MIQRTRCPITGSNQLSIRANLPFDSGLLAEWSTKRHRSTNLAGARFILLENPAIHFLFQQTVLDDAEETARRARTSAARTAPETANAPPLPLAPLCHKAEDAILIRLLHPDRTPRVLDYAMGSGRWAALAAAFGCETFGTDIDPAAEAAAAASGIRFLPIHTLDSLPAGHFDFINADQVFEHLPDPRSSLASLARLLRPGGHLKISTPEDRRIADKIARLNAGGFTAATFTAEFGALSPLTHVNLFTPTSLDALAATSGLVPFRPKLRLLYAATVGLLSARQINRAAYNPLKRHRARGTWRFYLKP